jgi:hypothetical protein
MVAALLIPLVAIWSILIPRQAYAFAPVGAAPIVITAMTAGGAVVGALTGVGVAVAIAGVAYWAFSDLMSGDEVRVPAVAGASGVVPAPAAPATVSPSYMCTAVGSGSFVQDGCNVSSITTVGSLVGSTCTYHTVSTSDNCPFPPYQRTYDTTAVASSGCPNGYTLAGSICNLSDGRVAVDDKKQDFERTGVGHAPYPSDLSGGLSGTTMTSDSANDTVVVAGKDSAGNAMQGKIIAKSDGGSQVELKTQKQTATGQTYVETKTFRTNGNGEVVSATQTATATQLNYDPVTKQYTETPSPAGTVAPDVGSAVPIQFPSDYARQGEAGSAAQTIANTLGPKIDAITQTGADPDDPVQPVGSEFDQAFFQGTFTNLLGWQLPGHSAQCPTASMVFYGSTLVFDAHCSIIDQFAGVLSTVATALWTIAALLIVLGA